MMELTVSMAECGRSHSLLLAGTNGADEVVHARSTYIHKVMHSVFVSTTHDKSWPSLQPISAWLAPADRKHRRACAARSPRSTIAPSTSTTPS